MEEKMINKTSLFKDWTNFRFGKRTLNFQKKSSSITKKSAPHIFTRYLLMYIVALFKSSEVTNTLYSLVEPSPGINTKFVLIDQDGCLVQPDIINQYFWDIKNLRYSIRKLKYSTQISCVDDPSICKKAKETDNGT